ncbi:FkbM family methyltransferase [Roseomonas sp. 18066]|uniref:FkbM family methyltransferase n=1 Tax=Roseomonas sp. 18066 TaxID=2681412 RepID=UPI001358D64E|nr:FkbM family methyltransferase [Roseomonas sp. 18066]
MMVPAALRGRALLRQLGVGMLAFGLLRRIGQESVAIRALRQAIAPGDCVWDIGARSGAHTRILAQCVASHGTVLAFEPLPQRHRRLEGAVEARDNILVLPFALSDRAGKASILAEQGLAAPQGMAEIILATGDSILAQDASLLPQLIRLDVAGHELEVLLGLSGTLRQPGLRHVVIALDGPPARPGRVEALLRGAGFRLDWLDPLTLHASRG